LLGIVARFAFWPLAFVGARELSDRRAIFVTLALILVALVASTVHRRLPKLAVVVSTIVVAVPSYAAARAAFVAMHVGPTLTALLAGACALAAAISYARTMVLVHPRPESPLDSNVIALAPVATWLAIAGVTTRFGAEAVHLHVAARTLSIVVASIGALLGAIAIATLVLQRRWIARVYRNEAPPLTVSALPDGISEESIRALSSIEGSHAVIAPLPETLDPYRTLRTTMARVPISLDVLSRHYAHRLWGAAFTFAGSIAVLALVTGSRAKIAHGGAYVPSTLPPLSGGCSSYDPPTIRFVALAPLQTLAVETIAERYRDAGLARVRVESPLPFEPRFLDTARGQLVAEEIMVAARNAHPRLTTHELMIVVTDRDMYLRHLPARYLFAARNDPTVVVSLARMDTSFPWTAPRSYVPRPPECLVQLRARAFKMITRQIVLGACRIGTKDDPRSILRHSVESLYDLDAMEETPF